MHDAFIFTNISDRDEKCTVWAMCLECLGLCHY